MLYAKCGNRALSGLDTIGDLGGVGLWNPGGRDSNSFMLKNDAIPRVGSCSP